MSVDRPGAERSRRAFAAPSKARTSPARAWPGTRRSAALRAAPILQQRLSCALPVAERRCTILPFWRDLR